MTGKAPGRADREGKGISLAQLMRMFPDNDAAEAWFAERRWEGEPHCPHCGSVKVQTGAKHPAMLYRCREAGCRKRFSVKVGACMEGSNLGYQAWAVAIYMMTTNLEGVSGMKLHRDLEITQKAAWHLAHRIRSSWTMRDAAMFGGLVEVDETYMGGKCKNMPRSERKKLTGRGAVGKTDVIGAKDRKTNKVKAHAVSDVDRPTVHDFIHGATDGAAQVYTDNARGYQSMNRAHEAVKHSVGAYVCGQAHTNGIESFRAMLNRGHNGAFHKIIPKHPPRCVAEFAGRHNDRSGDTADPMAGIVENMEGRRLRCRDLVADNGLPSGAR